MMYQFDRFISPELVLEQLLDDINRLETVVAFEENDETHGTTVLN